MFTFWQQNVRIFLVYVTLILQKFDFYWLDNDSLHFSGIVMANNNNDF